MFVEVNQRCIECEGVLKWHLEKIPRFSPSFSWREAAISAKEVLLPDQTDEKVRRFEHQFASYIGAKHALMVPSARYGFYLLLRALGVGEGDEVIIPALTYYAIPAMAPLAGSQGRPCRHRAQLTCT